MSRSFIKMNGLGNDFVVVQPGGERFEPTAEQARAICDRIDGVGCDQLILLEPSPTADMRLRIWNADGGEVDTCGNAARCVAWLLMRAGKRGHVRLEINAGTLEAFNAPGDTVTVDMGAPGLEWTDIPLAAPMDTLELDLRVESAKGGPSCVSMGNPHVVFFVDNVDTAPVESLGPWLEKHQRFPEGANVGFAQVLTRDRIRLRVWERGVGVTRACGTGACAALVAAHRRGHTGRRAVIETDGGELVVDWRESDGHVLINGPVEVEYTGRMPPLQEIESAQSATVTVAGVRPAAANDFGDPMGYDRFSGVPSPDPFRRA
jgi:diaminopimelate epimerase